MSGYFITQLKKVRSDIDHLIKVLEDHSERPKTPSVIDLDWESLYKAYPRKMGKSQGLKRLRQQIKTQKMYDRVKSAISNYREYCEKSETEPKFIMHFSTFVTKWQDWEQRPKTEKEMEYEKKQMQIERNRQRIQIQRKVMEGESIEPEKAMDYIKNIMKDIKNV